MDLLRDAGYALPEDLNDLDTLTPFGTTFRYDILSSTSPLDRTEACKLIRRARAWAEGKLQRGE